MELKNNLNGCDKALDFILGEIEQYSTDNLIVTLSYRSCPDCVGYCSYPVGKRKGKEFRIVAGINEKLQYPYEFTHTIGTKQWTGATKGFSWIWNTEILQDDNENLVWIFFHELWHFLCKTKQRKGNYQTKANLFGFDMVKKYRQLL